MQTQVVLASGALPALLSLLGSPKEGIRKEACWTVSNITAGSPAQIQAVIDAGIIPPLIRILQHADFKTKKEACWAMSNATSGGLAEPSQIRYLVQEGAIKPLCDLLQSTDNKIIQVALDGLENILKVGEADKEHHGGQNQYAALVEESGGMLSIHNLQHHENLEVRAASWTLVPSGHEKTDAPLTRSTQIYKKCFHLMDTFFPEDEGEETGIGGAQVDSSGAFALQSDLSAPQGGFSFVSDRVYRRALWMKRTGLTFARSLAVQHVLVCNLPSPWILSFYSTVCPRPPFRFLAFCLFSSQFHFRLQHHFGFPFLPCILLFRCALFAPMPALVAPRSSSH